MARSKFALHYILTCLLSVLIPVAVLMLVRAVTHKHGNASVITGGIVVVNVLGFNALKQVRRSHLSLRKYYMSILISAVVCAILAAIISLAA
ncbi:hypothetical protein ACTHGU_16090 [Chitinophagaceae bacterium MMS25-I14]